MTAPPVGRPVPGWSTRPVPDPDLLTGRWCRLERLTEAHAPDLHAAVTADPSQRQWTYLPWGPFTTLDEVAGMVRELVAGTRFHPLAIVDGATGRAAGMASYLRIEAEMGAVEVGGILYGAALQRTAAATEAMYLMARHAFDDLGYRRYEWKCDALNAPSRAAATRLGFAYEGTWRNAAVVKGRNRDTAWFAMTDDDWQELRPAFEAWLDPANHDGGAQRAALSAATAAVRARLDR